MKVVVTGANGFIGRPLCLTLRDRGRTVVAAVRPAARLDGGIARAPVAGLDGATDWRAGLAGAGAVVHLAARVHVMRETDADPVVAFRVANVEATLALAEQAAAAGVGHLVFLSSIKVNGEATTTTRFTPGGAAPADPYAVSKYEAEQGLAALAARTGLAVTVLRPPLVYGPGVKGNFRSLLGAVARGWPLPLGAIDNRRALIGLDNLVDAVGRALDRPPAPGVCRVFTLCDAETVSTPDLIRVLAAGMGRPARLVPVPPWALRLAGRITGHRAAIDRLTGSLEIDDRLIRDQLGWVAPVPLERGLTAVAAWWRSAAAE